MDGGREGQPALTPFKVGRCHRDPNTHRLWPCSRSCGSSSHDKHPSSSVLPGFAYPWAPPYSHHPIHPPSTSANYPVALLHYSSPLLREKNCFFLPFLSPVCLQYRPIGNNISTPNKQVRSILRYLRGSDVYHKQLTL